MTHISSKLTFTLYKLIQDLMIFFQCLFEVFCFHVAIGMNAQKRRKLFILMCPVNMLQCIRQSGNRRKITFCTAIGPE